MSSLISSYISQKRHGSTCTNTADSSRRGCGWPGWLLAAGLRRRLTWSIPPLPRDALSEIHTLTAVSLFVCTLPYREWPRPAWPTTTILLIEQRIGATFYLTGEKVAQRNSPGKEDGKEIYWDDNLSISYFSPNVISSSLPYILSSMISLQLWQGYRESGVSYLKDVKMEVQRG